ncbi:putative bifunctional diguanylate cyclase/phosphodiesterase [Brevibacillus migulae]|uniref:putative bifunctional diguanylate cyclase/phosphodiesterase n=1 Tax=Brevibacillus migulae TaxID=1644114 RepID=UPI001430C861|nr:EAL domain-containing protein [Brevibacillus migulae]
MQQVWFRRIAILTSGLILIASYLLSAFFQQNTGLLTISGALFSCVAFFFGTYGLWIAYRQATRPTRSIWLFLILGGLSSLVGHIGYFSYPIYYQTPTPVGNWIDYCWTLQTAFYFLAVIVGIAQNIRIHRNIRLLFDLLIIFTATVTLSWHYIIQPIIQAQGSHDHGSFVLALSGPIADIGILSGIVSIFLTPKRLFSARTLALFAFGMLIQVIADTGYLFQIASDSNSYAGYFAPLWLFALQLYGIAGLYRNEHTTDEEPIHAKPMAERVGVKGFLRVTIPYLFVLALFSSMLFPSGQLTCLLIGSFSCILLIIIRQVIMLVENNSLLNKMHQMTEELEQMVTERTDELSKKNRELAATLEQVEYMAYHDSLSGLPNRRLFEDRLANSLARAKRNDDQVAVLFLDMDRFRHVNDNLGHAFGDKLLIQVAANLYEWMEQCDTICRLSGDEFAILLEGFEETHQITDIVEKLIHHFNHPLRVEEHELHFTASIGIAVYPNDGQDPETLIKHAETAMYRVKKAGKNHYQFFDPTMADTSRFELEHALRKALERQELLVYYQPRVCTSSGRIVGMEALLRWQRPGHGLIPPGEFIPLAEETGLIIPIGEWVLRTACRQTKRWQEDGVAPLRVAVNLSALQFKQVDLVEMIGRILEETELPPCYLELEITESVAMQDVETAISKLKKLKEMGIEISIDDFGTGYSSLHYLGQFPIDTLKIDRSFVNEITHNTHHMAIVTAITALGHSLQLKVLAEGVEKDEQLHILRDIGCQEMQGYYYSPPVPADHFLELVVKQNPTL